MNSLYVINSNKEKELFSVEKVYNSARRAGASKETAKKIVKIVSKEVYPGIETSKIFKKIKRILRQEAPRVALAFNLKEGIRKLGPTGFPFENYVGEIFKGLGFEIKINQYLPGFCVSGYEIDFVAQKNNLVYMGECKYRNLPGERIHLREGLINYSRFSDILEGRYFKTKKYKNCVIKSIMVTNTKFTAKMRDYCLCKRVELLGWRHPKNKGLESFIEKQGLYPITILPSLKARLRDIFISENMMLASDVLKINSRKFAKKFKIPVGTLDLLIKEAKILFNQDKD